MANRRRSRWRLIQLVTLYILATTGSARKVSLQDFQHLSISDVASLSCFSAYSSPITGCTRAGFQQGAQCSDECAKGVQQESVSIGANCQGARIQMGTLLAIAFQGGLFEALCPGFGTTTITTTVQPTSSQSEVSIPTLTRGTTTAQTTSRASSETCSTTSSSTATSTASSEESSVISTSAASSEQSSTASSSQASSPGSSTTTDLQTTASTTDAVSTSVPSESTSTPSATTTASFGLGSSGGGSPFDPVIIAGSARTLPVRTEFMIGALAIIWIIALLAG
ncbi:hypothetical protein F5Y18DRAFT_335372 [Xylariaceae sp. FL1019]|nr:hypothetical protein F5Y18DRAFT_335372 [Xylariaceae sp. FL1019]